MSRRCDVLLIDESPNLDKPASGRCSSDRDELVAAPQPIVVERASVPGYWSCFDCCSPSPDSGAYFGWPATVSVSCSPGLRGLLVGLVGPVVRGFARVGLMPA
jgi:hypothetical protein